MNIFLLRVYNHFLPTSAFTCVPICLSTKTPYGGGRKVTTESDRHPPFSTADHHYRHLRRIAGASVRNHHQSQDRQTFSKP
ncbi:hypothetical protein L1987_30027 [Smallanthus sonchifolius]|uniref:Uncharacterized protein n=1 Tax=Smallanthus sonchifolius TaxID=185202 RepID=A0ACB9I345_9ASTR|nr:hypothetical protein L1987_30027 [Smallanthus sonchifolius]